MNNPAKPKKKPRFKLPGKLKGSGVRLTVRSPDGRNLILGRPKDPDRPDRRPIDGLLTFTGRAGSIYRNAADGNPFADYQLVQIEDCIRTTGEYLDGVADELAAIEARIDTDLMVHPPGQEPSSVTMRLGRYGTTVARLILQADKLAVQAADLRYHQVIDVRKDRNIRAGIRRKLRRLLAQGSNYKPADCTRQDLLQRNEAAHQAVEQLIGSGFLDRAMFSSIDEICDVYAAYDAAPEFGPIVMRKAKPDIPESDGEKPEGEAEATRRNFMRVFERYWMQKQGVTEDLVRL